MSLFVATLCTKELKKKLFELYRDGKERRQDRDGICTFGTVHWWNR